VILPDVNVLIYAFRSDSRDHERYRNWLLGVVNGESAYGMSAQVLASVIRITTHPKIYAHASDLTEVQTYCTTLLEQPICQTVTPGTRHWQIFTDLCQTSHASGNLVQDAWFAALAIESGCEWITTDGDYARFAGLSWSRPF